MTIKGSGLGVNQDVIGCCMPEFKLMAKHSELILTEENTVVG